MKQKKNKIKSTILATALVATAGMSSAGTSGMFSYNNLGSGQELRTALLGTNNADKGLELKCGEKSKGNTSASTKGKEGKCGEGKCGEGKCGDKKGKSSK